MKELLKDIVHLNAAAGQLPWIIENLDTTGTPAGFHSIFALIGRKCGKQPLTLSTEQQVQLSLLCPGYSLEGFTMDRLCRVYWLSGLESTDKARYFATIENLFLAADLSEQLGIYSALPVLVWPEIWEKRCAEGMRSNISTILEAILYGNPYAFQNLGEQAWNQLVLKAFFTGKDLTRIEGLLARNHRDLALMLLDYAHERQAAGRTVDPVLWRLVGPFGADALLKDFSGVFKGDDLQAKACLAAGIFQANFEPAKLLAYDAGFTETDESRSSLQLGSGLTGLSGAGFRPERPSIKKNK